MIEIQDILNECADAYISIHKLNSVEHKAVRLIRDYRTAKLGGLMDTCPECGVASQSYNSCRNRHCRKCQTLSKEKWIDSSKVDLLNIGYFHVVFTVPQKLNSIIYSNQ